MPAYSFYRSSKQRILESPLQEVVVTNTIPLNSNLKLNKITILSVAELIGEAIKSIHQELSVSKLFN